MKTIPVHVAVLQWLTYLLLISLPSPDTIIGSILCLIAVEFNTPLSCEHELLLDNSLTVAVASDKIGVRGPAWWRVENEPGDDATLLSRSDKRRPVGEVKGEPFGQGVHGELTGCDEDVIVFEVGSEHTGSWVEEGMSDWLTAVPVSSTSAGCTVVGWDGNIELVCDVDKLDVTGWNTESSNGHGSLTDTKT